MEKRTRVMAATLALVAVLAVSGCGSQTQDDLNHNTTAQTEMEPQRKVFEPKKHVPTKIVDNKVVENNNIEVPEGYEVVSVCPYNSAVSYYTVTYQNIVTVEVQSSSYTSNNGYRYAEFGTPIDVPQKIK